MIKDFFDNSEEEVIPLKSSPIIQNKNSADSEEEVVEKKTNRLNFDGTSIFQNLF